MINCYYVVMNFNIHIALYICPDASVVHVSGTGQLQAIPPHVDLPASFPLEVHSKGGNYDGV